MKNKLKLNNKGFSLVELIIVIAIMAVLMGVIAPTLIVNVEKSRESTDLQNIATIQSVVEAAMTDEAVYEEVMGAASESKVIIDLGETDQVGFDSAGLDSYPKFEKELKKTLKSDIYMKSTAALEDGNHLLIEVDKDGIIAVYVASGATADSSAAIPCSKTENADGSKKLFLISK